MLKEDYIELLKAKMMKHHWNNTTLSRRTGFSKAHIGNVLAGNGSDDALAAVCTALSIDVRTLLKGINIDNDSTEREHDSDKHREWKQVQSAPGVDK